MTQRDSATRRAFLRRAAAAASAVALTEIVPVNRLSAAPAQPAASPVPSPVPGSPALIRVGEITRRDGRLRALMSVKNRQQTVPQGQNTSRPVMMRYYEGRSLDHPGQIWPRPVAGTPPAQPGPTLRCQLGDRIEIAFFDLVNNGDFPKTLDRAETPGAETIAGCDALYSAGVPTGQTPPPAPTPAPNGWTPYPSIYPANDVYPDCIHGSSTANLHFHGTHVTPGTTGDNVLINVRPDISLRDPAAVQRVLTMFEEVWQHCSLGHVPHLWGDLPRDYRVWQKAALENYDKRLPPKQRLWPQNQTAINDEQWPQWYVGAYPYCFQIPPPEADGKPKALAMGQAPGTHWYHSHKHGSTAINMFNGMSGALIIEDPSPNGYDRKLRAFYGNDHAGKPKLDELVLVFQELTNASNLLGNRGGRVKTVVNGQFAPTITMQAGQVQLWRMINANVANVVGVAFQAFSSSPASAPPTSSPTSPPSGKTIAYRQTAQDGVQLAWRTYRDQNTAKFPVSLAPGNRADLLVQAPDEPGVYVMLSTDPEIAQAGPVLYVNVVGPKIAPMGFPSRPDQWPQRPTWLNDVAPSGKKSRTIDFGVKSPDPDGTPRTGTGKGNNGILPEFTINGKQFTENTVDERMALGSTEEWVIINSTTGIAHPFHIHVNPFQIFEVFDPASDPKNAKPQPFRPPGPFVWWDTFAIPAAVVVTQDTVDPLTQKTIAKGGLLPGYFKMRTRFVDFTGFYVDHCHILMHEDRGMMQLVEVYDPKHPPRHRYIPKHH
jgi:FtsP/CotA-like multicopper oxidase with cupredoxin domain